MDAAEIQQDPFQSLIKLCEPIDSQNEKFPNCPFARESDTIMESNPDQFSPSPEETPEQIVMVSAPGSANTADQLMPEEDAVFHTPPEHHTHSHLSSSEDQNPREFAEGVRIADRTTEVRVSEAGLDDYPETKRARVVAGEEFEGVADEVIASGSGDSNGEDADAVNGNHELGKKIECSKGIGVTGSSRSLDSCKIERECDDETVPMEETVPLGETELDETEGDEVIALGSRDSKMAEGSLGGLMKDGVAIDGFGEKIEYATGMEVARCDKSDSSVEIERDVAKLKHSAKRIEEFRYSAEGGDGRRERQLPASMVGKDEDVVDEKSSEERRASPLPPSDVVEGSPKKSDQGWVELVNRLSTVFGFEDGKADFIETAERKGIKFPRPRWWPPPGEDF